MMTILQYPPVTNPKFIKNKNIESHSPKIKYEKSNAPEHREHIFHGINSIVVFYNIHQSKSKQ